MEKIHYNNMIHHVLKGNMELKEKMADVHHVFLADSVVLCDESLFYAVFIM